MATKTTKRAADLKDLTLIVALVAAGRLSPTYRPTLTDPETADAFDAAMQHLGNPTRAWRGSAAKAA